MLTVHKKVQTIEEQAWQLCMQQEGVPVCKEK